VDTRINFGGIAGFRLFGRPADAWKKIMKMNFKLVKVFRWVDNNLFIRKQGASISMRHIVAKSLTLGVMTNEKKYLDFSNEQKFIGFVWDGIKKTVWLPEGKVAERLSQITPFLEANKESSYNNVEVLVGRLNHVSYILPHLKCKLCLLYCWLKSWVHRLATRPTPEDARRDLTIWVETLENFRETQIINWGPPIDIRWVNFNQIKITTFSTHPNSFSNKKKYIHSISLSIIIVSLHQNLSTLPLHSYSPLPSVPFLTPPHIQ
jgi:hypothetical protein